MPLKRKTESEENEGSLNLEDETSTSETATPVKKRPGRPRKPESEKKRKTPSGRSRGRPRIYPVVEKTPKLPRGRPKKSPGKKLQLHRQFPAWRVNSLDLLKRKLLTMNAQLTEYEEQKLELEKRMIIIKQRKLQLERDILSYKPSVALDSGKSSGSSPRKRGRPSLKSSGDSTDDQEPVADSHCTVEQSENSSGSTPRKRGRPSLKPSGDSTDDQEPVTDNHCTVEQTEHSSGWSSPRKRGRPSLKPSGDSTDDQQNNSASVKRGRGRRGLNTSAKKEKKVTNQGDLGSKKKRGRRSKLDFSESVTITEESSDDMEEPSAELKE